VTLAFFVPLAAALVAWLLTRRETAAWRALSQQGPAGATLPSCAAAAAAGAAWAAAFPPRATGPVADAAVPRGHARFDLLPPAWASRRLRKYGPPGDGSKWLLDVSYLAPPAVALRPGGGGGPAPCVVYSLGGSMQTEFEEAMLTATSCDVLTADCSVSTDAMAAVIARTPRAAGRFSFTPTCLGTSGASATINGARHTLKSAREVMASAGHERLAVLKMDIEGGEHAAPPAFLRDAPPGGLPGQVSLEVHWLQRGLVPLLVVRDLVRAGYVLVSREDNPHCTNCTELSFVHGCEGVPGAGE
jgi:hypothetical protein